MYRKTYALINKRDIENNVKEIISKFSNYNYYIGVVKANAYGHGIEVIESMLKGGINYLAVSSLDEAIEIRGIYKEIPILVLEPVSLEYIDVCVNNNITITLESYSYFKELCEKPISDKLLIHLKIDSGMNRLGFNNKEEIEEVVGFLNKSTNHILEGIYTHLATSGVFDGYYIYQVNKFRELTRNIDLSSIQMVHIGKSTTLVSHDKPGFVNAVRLGIIMYGFDSSFKMGSGIRTKLRMMKRDYLIKNGKLSKTYLSNDLKLTKTFKLYTEVMAIKKVDNNGNVGYAYKMKEECLVAILPIGFADGIKGIKYVSINDSKYEVIPNMCMDMTFVKIDETIKVGDKVEIFGNNISINEVTNSLNIGAHQLFTKITNRVERKYIDE